MEKKKMVLMLALFGMVCMMSGISYAFFTYILKGSVENTIQTGNLTFVYDEQNKQGNGIVLANAFPMSDETGKLQFGSNAVFDFQVLATTLGETISYEVIGEKDAMSNLDENLVKIYLTTVSGTEEREVETTIKEGTVTTYDQLVDTSLEGQTGKTLYQEMIPKDQANYVKNFRLRMWVSEEANHAIDGEWEQNNKTFTIRINVVANRDLTTVDTLYTSDVLLAYNYVGDKEAPSQFPNKGEGYYGQSVSCKNGTAKWSNDLWTLTNIQSEGEKAVSCQITLGDEPLQNNTIDNNYENLRPENIVSGVQIGDITGTGLSVHNEQTAKVTGSGDKLSYRVTKPGRYLVGVVATADPQNYYSNRTTSIRVNGVAVTSSASSNNYNANTAIVTVNKDDVITAYVNAQVGSGEVSNLSLFVSFLE